MTVISQDGIATFEGNDIAAASSFDFRFFKDSDLKLTVADPEGTQSNSPLVIQCRGRRCRGGTPGRELTARLSYSW